MTNMSWKNAILEVVCRKRGHEITLQEIYKKVLLLPLVTESHKKPWTSGGQPKYQCWIRRYLTDLVSEGSVARLRKGVYKSN